MTTMGALAKGARQTAAWRGCCNVSQEPGQRGTISCCWERRSRTTVECRESSERLNLIRALGGVEPSRAVQAVGCDWALFHIRAKRGGSLQLATATHTAPKHLVQGTCPSRPGPQATSQTVHRCYLLLLSSPRGEGG